MAAFPMWRVDDVHRKAVVCSSPRPCQDSHLPHRQFPHPPSPMAGHNKGYEAGLDAAGISPDLRIVLEGDGTIESGRLRR